MNLKFVCVVVCQREGFGPVTNFETFTVTAAIPSSNGQQAVRVLNVEQVATLHNGVRIKVEGSVKMKKIRLKGFQPAYVVSCDTVEVLDDDYIPFSR